MLPLLYTCIESVSVTRDFRSTEDSSSNAFVIVGVIVFGGSSKISIVSVDILFEFFNDRKISAER